jgi:translocation and assembly module TamA
LSFVFAALLAFSADAAAKEKTPPCSGVVFTGPNVKLTAVERRLVCGDPDSEAWKDVSQADARRFLETFLQQRGYLHPAFAEAGGRLVVDVGKITAIERLEGDGFPAGLDLGKRRGIVGAPLTPAKLDEVQAALTGELQNRGYACPEVAMSADARTGEVRARFLGGVAHAAEPIEEPSVDGVDPEIFRRYEAFERDRPLNQDLLKLTSTRVVAEALFLNSSYDVTCGTQGVRIVHRVAAAPPRLVSIGVGVDTEGLASVRARWIHSRIGARADTAQAILFASAREESLDARMNLYLSPSSRAFLLPRAVAARSDEPLFETESSEISLSPAFTWDGQALHVEFSAGPALEYADTQRGLGPLHDLFQSFNTHLAVTSHLFEAYLREPRNGFRAELDTASRVAGVNSSLTANRVRLGTEKLWNLGSFDPPLAVLGARGWAGTTVVSDPAAALPQLPPASRFFIGGNADFRGVGTGELSDQNGFLSGVYEGLELRGGDLLLPYKLQPIVFVDAAMGGHSSLQLDPNVYYAPGFGARWSTFVGSFRVSFARNLVWQRDPATFPGRPHWQFFFSYGQEF